MKFDLNPSQEEAAQYLDGPLLVIAGAGSGKTRVLTSRIANLIHQKKAKPHEILAVTFTNKAAREMKERVENILGQRSLSSLWVSTFHSACVRILREEIENLQKGYTSQFAIYDDQDQLSCIKQCLKFLNWDEQKWSPRVLQGRIEEAKNLGFLPQELQKKSSSFYDEKMVEFYKFYQENMQKANSLDFGDLILLTVELFKHYPSILEKYQNQFRYCLVDEYQDTNHIQYLFIKFLTQNHKNICVVGDEDQSIYSWRGADISNILSFEKDFRSVKVIKLEQNYRSTQSIIEAASFLISNNLSRKHKKLWTQNDKGALVSVVRIEDEYQEAYFVVQEILKYLKEGRFLSETAIFYRTNAQSRVLEEALRRNSLLYKIYGGMHFYGRAEVKDIHAYFKLIANFNDNVSFLRIINTPTRGIGKTTIQKIVDYANQKRISLFEAASQLVSHLESQGHSERNEGASIFNAGTKDKLEVFVRLISELSAHKTGQSLQKLYHDLLDKTRYVEFLKEEGTIEALSRIENLEELDSALGEFVKRSPKGGLQDYLQEISLVSDLDSLDENEDCVKLMTLHAAKGLEFPIVFMVGLEEGLFPHTQSSFELSEIEEERRLCYVGMTRTKEILFMSHAGSRRVHGSPQYNLPSRFLQEISEEYCMRVDFRRKVTRAASYFVGKGRRVLTDDIRDESIIYEDNFNQEIEEKCFAAGMRLRHPSFGIGIICRVEGENDNPKLTVKFGNGSVKKFLAAQVQFERI